MSDERTITEDLEKRANDAWTRVENARRKRAGLEARLKKAAVAARKAEDYRAVMNLMSAHVHCQLNQDFEAELDRYWSGRDDIAYANGDMAYVGRAAVQAYYVGHAEACARRAGEIVRRIHGCETEGQKEPGYKNMNLIGTPYVEIAGDGMTAKGIWMAHSFMGRLDENGVLVTQGVLSRYSGEFIRENGQWKLWRRRNYADVVFEEKPAAGLGPPPPADGKPPKPMVENPRPTELTKIKAPQSAYGPTALPAGGPALPEPYDTWRYETSYVQKEDASW